MKSMIAMITISTGGVLRLNSELRKRSGIRKGDKLVVFKEDDRVTIQVQRVDAVILRLRDATIIRGGAAT